MNELDGFFATFELILKHFFISIVSQFYSLIQKAIIRLSLRHHNPVFTGVSRHEPQLIIT
ncbi:MAG: hypothetical protein WCS19_02595 [Candidatus Cloacimonadaceae bacterium]